MRHRDEFMTFGWIVTLLWLVALVANALTPDDAPDGVTYSAPPVVLACLWSLGIVFAAFTGAF